MPEQELWTRNLTAADSPFTIEKNFGVSKFSVTNNSPAAQMIYVVGTKNLGGRYPSQPYPVPADESFNFTEGMQVKDYTITLDAGATAKIVAIA
jgi:hypothetical protein